jgi:hypothetical protein
MIRAFSPLESMPVAKSTVLMAKILPLLLIMALSPLESMANASSPPI